jgi:hypothetical protein
VFEVVWVSFTQMDGCCGRWHNPGEFRAFPGEIRFDDEFFRAIEIGEGCPLTGHIGQRFKRAMNYNAIRGRGR